MTLDEKFGIPFFLALMALVVASVMTSANNYLEVVRFNLLDARQGERVMLDYDRLIKRDFDASWRLDLYRNGVFTMSASSPGVHRYRTTAELPPKSDLDLFWLSYDDPEFLDLPCGDYEAAVQWTINPGSVLMKRTVETRDDFMVVCQ